jgi:3-oxoacyl-(acyl-carrier-protein) synthase
VGRIYVTGMGIISAIGDSVVQNHDALRNGKCGISALGLFPSKYSGELPCGEIKTSTASFREQFKEHLEGVTRTSLLARHAFEEAMADAGWSSRFIVSPETALINATTVGGMCLTDELYEDANAAANGSVYLSSYDCGSVALYLQKKFHVGGIINTINTACSSSANAIMLGARLIRSGKATRVIVGGVDSLSKFTLNGFHALHILSPDICRPFDQQRKGLNLGEGAAFLVLEKEEDIHNRKVYAEVTGYGNANDSFHPSSLSEEGDGPYLSMKDALAVSKLTPGDIDFINAHGTGTENNDASESMAMIRLFERPPAFASTKSNTGHTLGAAGAVEAVYSILALVHQEAYPNLHFESAIEGSGLVPVTAFTPMPVNHIMSNSFGFGGNCTSLIFSKA